MFRKFTLMLGVTLGLLAAASSSMAQSTPAQVTDGVLTGKNGMTLYTFDRDVAGSGKSVCNGPCATNWPPLVTADDAKVAGDYSIVVRDDGAKQIAYKGMPLYYWVKDTKPGDKTGNGVNNLWRTATP